MAAVVPKTKRIQIPLVDLVGRFERTSRLFAWFRAHATRFCGLFGQLIWSIDQIKAQKNNSESL
jgi:hypothetical protein